MQVTTSGEIRNKSFYNKDSIDNFIKNERETLLSLLTKQNVVYNNNISVSDAAINYLNILPDNEGVDCIKSLILKEFYDCEKIYHEMDVSKHKP